MFRRFAESDALPQTVTGLVCLVVGVLIGWTVSSLASARPAVPTAEDIRALCRVAPGVRRRRWTHIVLHHSADDSGDAAQFDKLHRSRGWKRGLGYDFVIGNGSRSGDGEIEVGRRWTRQLDGAHCLASGMNERAIGICFVGNFETGPGPTPAQIASGIALIRHLAAAFSIPAENIAGHGEVRGAKTLCPGRHFPVELFRALARGPR